MLYSRFLLASLVAQRLKRLPAMWETGPITGSGRSPEGNDNPLQYSCLENPMDGGAWWAIVHGVAKSQTRLSDFTFTFISIFTLSLGREKRPVLKQQLPLNMAARVVSLLTHSSSLPHKVLRDTEEDARLPLT